MFVCIEGIKSKGLNPGCIVHTAGHKIPSTVFGADGYFDLTISNVEHASLHKYMAQNGSSMFWAISEIAQWVKMMTQDLLPRAHIKPRHGSACW